MIKTVWAEWEQLCADNNDEEVDDSDKLSEDQVTPNPCSKCQHSLITSTPNTLFLLDSLFTK
jgi:hypothetical protein